MLNILQGEGFKSHICSVKCLTFERDSLKFVNRKAPKPMNLETPKLAWDILART